MAGRRVTRGAKLALFLAGLFFGGAIDHVILALMGRVETPYGVRAGVAGNWALAGLDLLITLGFWAAYRALERRASAFAPRCDHADSPAAPGAP
jgi:hypothetical protein